MSATIVFDLDGTLVDSIHDIAGAVNRMLAEQGHDALSLETVTGFVGNGLPHLVSLVIGHCDIDPSLHGKLTQATLNHYNRHSCDETRVYPGVTEALTTLNDRGCALGLCTNKPEEPARHVLAALGLQQFFDVVIGGDTLPRRKPDPAPLLATYHALPAAPRLFVGDSEVDAETARRAEIPFLLFTQGYRKSPLSEIHHDATYDHSRDLPDLVQKQLMI